MLGSTSFHVLCLAGLTLLLPGRMAADAAEAFETAATARHGEAGRNAARFLVEHMPPGDRQNLSSEFLGENLDLAFRARTEFPWATNVPVEIFHNDVLPYAVFDEPRDPWRTDFYEKARSIVKEARSASEAAQLLNRDLFKLIDVHYHTGRKRPNQSPKESIAINKATCTGLSIILVDACRAVGIPARAVGTPLWINERGNHTWVEIWDGKWHFTGADEYDPAGLNRGWFTGDASQARADVPKHAIYATSWKRDGVHFPMVWARGNTNVAAVNVTALYARTAGSDSDLARLGVRLWDARAGSRLPSKVCVLDGVRRTCALAETKAGTADLNDMPRFQLRPGTQGWLRFTRGDEVREMPFPALAKGEATIDAIWKELQPVTPAMVRFEAWLDAPASEKSSLSDNLESPLTRNDAGRVIERMTLHRKRQFIEERTQEMENRSVTIGDKTLRWLERSFGENAPNGPSLWISMHGGGNAAAAVNDRQWQNQIKLYEPSEGIYLAPRAPTDTWNLWHQDHIDPLFQRLVDNYVALRGVNPNRIYLMGYSAGGDGVWQLAPRMADRFAAASMMAGHPNEASLLGLRNLPFAIFMGGNDSAYNRNRVAADRGAELERLRQSDPDGYPHLVRIYEGLGHWMEKKDAEALPWMAGFTRNPWPKKVVWQQDDVVHDRFYWLQVPNREAVRERPKMVAEVRGQTIELEGTISPDTTLRLSDLLVDLDQPIQVVSNGKQIHSGIVPRTAQAIVQSLQQRLDPASAATALLRLQP